MQDKPVFSRSVLEEAEEWGCNMLYISGQDFFHQTLPPELQGKSTEAAGAYLDWDQGL